MSNADAHPVQTPHSTRGGARVREGRCYGRGRGRGWSGGRGRGRGQRPHLSNAEMHSPERGRGGAVSGRSSARSGPRRSPRSSGRRRFMFPEYMEEVAVRQGLESGHLQQGRLRVNAKNPSECYVDVQQERFLYDVAVIGPRCRNRAFAGDLVALELLPQDTWRRRRTATAADAVVDALQDDFAALDLEVGQAVVHTDVPEPPKVDDLQALARVVYILERSEDASSGIVGFLRCSDNTQKLPENGEFLKFVPFAKTIPHAIVPRRHWPKDITSDDDDEINAVWNAIYSTSFEAWLPEQRFPSSAALERIGSAGNIDTEIEALLCASKIGHRAEFDATIIQSLASFEGQINSGHWTIPADEIGRRRDLRSQRIFTIDPLTAKDLDDALHIQQMPDGTFEIGVHVADVSYFVKEGTAVDKEAQNRCTSVYLIQKVIPMLPALLCEQLCSLNPGVDRLAFSVIWRMNREGFVCHEYPPWFGRTIIRSCCKLDYSSAQRMIDGEIVEEADLPAHISLSKDHSVSCVITDCRNLNQIAQKRRRNRFEMGSLSLDRPTMSFKFGNDVNYPVSVKVYELLDANRLVEEYMLLANMFVARRLADKVPSICLLRRHNEPVRTVLDQVVRTCALAGYTIDGESAASLQRTVQRVSSEKVRECISVLLSVAMPRAMYFCLNGVDDPSYCLHYALNFDIYTHFTSPIRRYADVLVHRMLAYTISGDHQLIDADEVARLAMRCNEMSARAEEAGRMSSHVCLVALLRKEDLVEDAVLLDTGVKTCKIYVPRLGLEGRIFLDRIKGAVRAEVVHNGDGTKRLELVWKDSQCIQTVGIFEPLEVLLSATKQVPFEIEFNVLPPRAAAKAESTPTEPEAPTAGENVIFS